MAVTRIITPVLQEARKPLFSKRLEAALIEFDFYKIQLYISRFRSSAVFKVRKILHARKKLNAKKKSLNVLLIRLEYIYQLTLSIGKHSYLVSGSVETITLVFALNWVGSHDSLRASYAESS